MTDKKNLSPTRRLFASDTFRRHYVSAVENGDQAEWAEQEKGGNLGRVFVFLLLLHVFLIGAIVLYNLVSDRPKQAMSNGVGKAPIAEGAAVAGTTDESNVLRRSELSEYQVRSGDSLKSISDATGATTDEIIKLNQLDSNGELYVGRRLSLPMRKTAPQEVPAPAAVAIPVPAATKNEHTVAAAKEVSGKTAGKGQPEGFKAATTTTSPNKAKGVTLQDTPPADHARTVSQADAPPAGRMETAGSTQKVPVAPPVKIQEAPPAPVKEKPAAKPPVVAAAPEKEKPKPAPAAAGGGRAYEIKGGDTFYSIARKNGINVNELIKANPGVNPSRLQKGMAIKIPAK